MYSKHAAKRGKILPFWTSILFVVSCTFVSYWYLGGQNYLANHAELNYSLFRHAEEDGGLFGYISLFMCGGGFGALVGLHLSFLALILWNWKSKVESIVEFILPYPTNTNFQCPDNQS